MVADLRYFNSLELEVDSLRSQLETQKTRFLNEIDRLSWEYYYANHILGVYTKLDEVTNLQCDYLETLNKCECLEKEISKCKMMSKSFKALQKHAINLEIDLQQFLESSITGQRHCNNQRPSSLGKPTIFLDSLERKDFSKSKSVTKNNVSNDFSKPVTTQILPPHKKSILKNTNVLAPRMYKLHTKPTHIRTSQLPHDFRKTNKRVSFSTGVIPNTSVSRPKLKSNPMEDIVMLNNSQKKKQEVEDHRRNVKFSKNKTSVTACTVKFGNDQIAPILGYEDLVQGAVTIKRYTWTHFLRSKDETPEVLIDFLRLVRRGLHAQVRIVQTNKGTEFFNKTLHAYFASEGINHQTSVARTHEQNDVVKRRNRTLVEAARTMLSVAKVHLNGENLDKMKEKGDACIFVRYSTLSRAYRIFNKRTRVIVETIHVNLNELPQMASDHVSSDPVPQCQRKALEHDSLSPGPQCQENVPHVAGIVTMLNGLDLLFSPMFDELLNGSTQVVSKSFAVTTADAPNQCQQQLTTPLNTQTTYDLTYHPLEQIIGNPSQSVRTRRQLESDGEMYGFVDPYHPDKVYRLKKALYRLRQAPRACVGTPMATKHLDADLSGNSVDQAKYQSIVGALMYLTASRPDIVHATCYCARYQAKPTEKHLIAVVASDDLRDALSVLYLASANL
nr:hypothetical protein [Tanacetum cinerariifolium]